MKRLACATAIALLAVACSSSDTNDPPASPAPSASTPTQPGAPPGSSGDAGKPDGPDAPKPDPATKADCDALASAFCQRLSECDHFAPKVFGSVATCTERYSGFCAAGAAAPGTGMTHTALTSCTPKIASATCDALFEGDAPAACSFDGTLADAAQCAFGHQCKSGRCSATDTSCGTCQHVPALGESCAGGASCVAGAYCDSTDKCAARTPLGNACTGGVGAHCVTNGSCVNGTCTGFAKANEACDKNGVTAPMCDLAGGLACVNGSCAPFPIETTPGGTCGFDQTTLTLCGPGLSCAYGSGGTGSCVAEIPEGGACTAGSGGTSTCALALQCIGGKCGYKTAAVCK